MQSPHAPAADYLEIIERLKEVMKQAGKKVWRQAGSQGSQTSRIASQARSSELVFRA